MSQTPFSLQLPLQHAYGGSVPQFLRSLFRCASASRMLSNLYSMLPYDFLPFDKSKFMLILP